MRSSTTALSCLLLGIPMFAADPKKEAGPANRLAKESSPYLLQHAHNPVDWYPWGAEAFEKAKKEKKVVFLSIGYSSCHWCHVMERESFQDKEIAKILNEHFICIKVDREERPDIDEIYMTALQVIGGSGGWPLSMFLTDDGKPIVGGTYWPKEDRKLGDEVARGFKSILNYMIELKKDKDKELREQADEVAERTEEVLTRASRLLALVPLGKALAMGPAEALRDRLDPVHGGIGNPPRFAGTKFPMPPSLQALMRAAHRDNDKPLKDLVALTLTKMAEGGIYDQIGGGFHRYSTERTWTVPHFEKMLYDNAQLIELYSEAYSLEPRKLYERVVSESISFVLREMTSPEGAFYSALDADSDGHEGLFYVWTGEEIEKAMEDPAEAKLLRAVFSVTGPPSFEDKSYVLRITRPVAEIAKDFKLTEDELQIRLALPKARLLIARNKRNRPFLDTKVLTAWNGQMIAGMARAGEVFRNKEYVDSAARAADFVLARLRTPEGRLLRTYSQKGDGTFEAKLNAYLDDYAYLIHGLLTLHDATREDRWLKDARALMETMIRLHGDGDRGGYFFTSSDHEKLFARPKDYHDGVQPSGNSVTARNLVRLWKKTGEEKYRALAEKSFKQFAAALQSQPGSTAHMAEALHLFLELGGKKEEAEPKSAPPAKLKGSQDVVEASAKLGEPDKDGKRAVTVTLKVQKGWHIYANPVENDDLELARTTVEVFAEGKKLPGKILYPKGSVVKDEKVGDYQVYEGEVVIPGTITAGEAKELEVRVKLQACDGNRCLQPATIPLPVK